mgnify:CR=1 FL=1
MYKRYELSLFVLGYVISGLAVLVALALKLDGVTDQEVFTDIFAGIIASYILSVVYGIHGIWKNTKAKQVVGKYRKHDLFINYCYAYAPFIISTVYTAYVLYNRA